MALTTNVPMPRPHDALPLLEGSWIGDVRGTTIGNAYVETTVRHDQLLFDIRIAGSGQVTVCKGILRDENGPNVRFEVVPAPGAADGPSVVGVLRFDVFTTERMTGKWSTTTGESGLLWAQKATTRSAADGNATNVTDGPPQPVELVAKETALPSVTLYRRDLEAIIQRLAIILPVPARVVVTADADDRAVSMFADDFLRRRDLPRVLNHVKLNITDNARPFAKSILVVLSARESSKIIVTSDNATWTTGTNAELATFMRRYTSRARVLFQNYGLSINGLLILGAIVAAPELPTISRILFLAVVVATLTAFAAVHGRITRTTIYLDSTERGAFVKEMPTFLLSLLASAATWGVAEVYGYLRSDAFAELLRLIGMSP